VVGVSALEACAFEVELEESVVVTAFSDDCEKLVVAAALSIFSFPVVTIWRDCPVIPV